MQIGDTQGDETEALLHWWRRVPPGSQSASESRLLVVYARPMLTRPQPLLVVADVQRASRWYQQVLEAVSGHGGDEYEQVLVDGLMVLQLHA